MPEGPSLVILRELVEELKLEGKEILKVTGNTKIAKERMLYQKVVGFKTWGKHFLICFDGFALRIHLMMFGSYRINDRKDVEPRIGFEFKNAELNFYTCSLEFIEGDLNKVYDWQVDIMSDDWDTKATIKKLKAEPESLVCDVLLNQQLFAGSGNIIKNEVLYRTELHPLNKISSLPAAKLKALVVNARAYAFDFLEWKRAYVLKKHWLIYGKKLCPKKHEVHKEELGKNKRITFFCPICQKRYKVKTSV
ncbi:endonuclease [Pedobacter polaris]|uniref:Endonuclease n=1 Tax=Pedobacter polaris TaxID=2571273 RepID=A0A4U1CNV4_9SPHI|nr:DNA-formamidopyrimidine glycosylase family protein [Pedobacter polaris]TKC08393.1 endonuclease [Pedobacter polaris]